MPEPREDIDALIVRTRAAHEALKDLKAGIKEAQDAIKATEAAQRHLLVALTQTVDSAIADAIDIGLQNYSTAIEIAIQDAQQAVYDRFDVIAAILLGEKEERTITEDARLVRKYLDKQQELTEGENRRVDTMRADIQRKLGGRPSDLR